MTNHREILRLESLGINKTQISASCGCSRTTVIEVLRNAEACGLKYPLPEEMTDEQITGMLHPASPAKTTYKKPNYEDIHHEMGKSGVTLSLLWVEYCEHCRESGEIPYKSTQFNKYYSDYVKSTGATMHLNHKPGEIMQVDWAGDTAHIIDTDTGEQMAAYMFVATLPYSGYAYAEAYLSMNQEAWISAHINAFRYFGGTARIIQCDNLKTGVERNTASETVLNKSYQEMAEHYGIAVIPCRVRTPTDKGHVEGTVGILSTWILAAIRNQQFLSLPELNGAVREKLDAFNSKPFQKKDGSRATAFLEERAFLSPLPERTFELSMWKIATVGLNYHISTDRQNYSVPYECIRQRVDVRITRNVIEVFFEGNRVCSHPRLYGRPNQYSTAEAHMPPDHRKYISWNSDRFLRWAEKIGVNTAAVVRFYLGYGPVEQQGYKSCMTLLKLVDKYSVERVEAACCRALQYTARPALKNIQAILKSGQDKLGLEKTSGSSSEPSLQYGFTRGAEYYGRRDDKC